VAHDPILADAHRLRIDEEAKVGIRGERGFHLDQARLIQARRRHRLLLRLLQPVLVGALPVALDLRIPRGARKCQDSEDEESQFRSAASAARTSGCSSALAWYCG